MWIFNTPKYTSQIFFNFFSLLYQATFLWGPYNVKKNKKIIFAHENMKKQPSNLLIIQNQQFFSLPVWLPKRSILGRNRNFIGSPCLLSTISLSTYLICFIFIFYRRSSDDIEKQRRASNSPELRYKIQNYIILIECLEIFFLQKERILFLISNVKYQTKFD